MCRFLCITILFAASANAGPIGLGDFSNPTVDTLTSIGIDPWPTPHFVVNRPTFQVTAVQGWIQYYTDPCAILQGCVDPGSLWTNWSATSNVWDITFDQPYKKVGLTIGRSTFGRTFYDANDNLIGTYDQTDYFGNHFMAWEDPNGIKRIRLETLPGIDNIYIEDAVSSTVPEPASGLLVAAAMLGVAFFRRR